MDVYQPDRKSKTRARDRVARRRKQMATPSDTRSVTPPPIVGHVSSAPDEPRERRADSARMRLENGIGGLRRAAADRDRGRVQTPERVDYQTWKSRARLARRDLWWHVQRNPYIVPGIVGLLAVVFVGFVALRVLQGRIFPNVYALGISLDNLTVQEAEIALLDAWSKLTIQLVDDQRTWTASPSQMGLRLNARATAESARALGLSGVPFGYYLLPTVEMDTLATQTYLLDMTETTKIDPYNAGYQWQGDTLVGVPGAPGRFLDVAMTMEHLQNNLAEVASGRRLNLVMTPMQPDVLDAEPYLEQAAALAQQQFVMAGYDPFTDERVMWTTDRDTFTSWLEAGENGLGLRADKFALFLQAATQQVAQTDPRRFLESTDSMDKVRQAISQGRANVNLRIRYRSGTYEVERGDTGYRIARRTGIPFYLIEQANPGRDWDALLSPGDIINLPSRDVTIPLDPVPTKRIVVNLDTQYMVAYENGQPVFQWSISSGISSAPTYPGVFQIQNHDELARGSSYTLCGSSGCGEWQMYWFMGIYEVVPGLMNGFHGAVLLPNGAYLGGGNVGTPYTFGCVMSENGNAEQLYRWADVGTIVEIISSEFQPQSPLGQRVASGAALVS